MRSFVFLLCFLRFLSYTSAKHPEREFDRLWNSKGTSYFLLIHRLNAAKAVFFKEDRLWL